MDAAGQGDRSEVGGALCGAAGAYVAEHAQSTPEGRSFRRSRVALERGP